MPNLEDLYIIGDENTTVNLGFLYEIAEQDAAFILLMIDTFIKTNEIIAKEMIVACELKNWNTLQNKAHFTKSSLSVIRVKQMYELAATIEDNCKTGTLLHEISNKVIALTDQFHKAKNILLVHKSTILKTEN